jgi:hypothetical protein
MVMKIHVTVFWVAMPYSVAATRSSEMLVFYHITTQHHNPEDDDMKHFISPFFV